jgi:N-hydroxyarylamine O-acetyltransferase
MRTLDLASYLARIGYSGPKTATLETLQALHALHPAAIPFENLDVLLKRPIRLDVPSVAAKLVDRRRGGYCFEQNGLFQAALQELGFAVRGLAARPQWRRPEGLPPPRSHMVLLVSLPEGDFLADAGFGGLSLTAALRLDTEAAQPTPHGLFRLVRTEDEFQLQVKAREGWEPVYQMSLHEQAAADWEMANWYTSAFPGSHFTERLTAARIVGDRRYGLLDNALSIHAPDGRTERRELQTPEELAAVLRDDFGIALPEGVEGLLPRLVRR